MRTPQQHRPAPRQGHGLRLLRLVVSGLLYTLLSGCASPGVGFLPGEDSGPRIPVNVSQVPNAIPRVEPRSTSGNPRSYVVDGRRYYVRRSSLGYVARGIASWYGAKFHGRKTASGERYNMYAMTAANKTLPLPTYAWVTNLRNGRRVIVRVNDRGPFRDNRLIDLSYAAAKKLGIIATGTAPVEVRAIDPRTWQRNHPYPPGPSFAPPHPAPHPVARTTPMASIYLQIGAFTERANAEHLRDRLLATFRSVHISRANSAQGPVYQVRIGPVRSADALANKANALRNIGMHYIPITIE